MQFSYSELRQNLAQTIKDVADSHQPAIITSHHKPAAVLISYEDYQSLEETAYLLRSPANAKRLLTAIIDIQRSKHLTEHDLIEDK